MKEIIFKQDMKIYKILRFLILFSFIWIATEASSQTGQVPVLMDVGYAHQTLTKAIDQLNDQIKDIQNSGGTVDPELFVKLDLFLAVNEILAKNYTGTTTFSALAANANYKALKMDDEAYQDLLAGIWDANFVELIELLKK